MIHIKNIIISILFLTIISCSHKSPDQIKLSKKTWGNLHGWETENHQEAFDSFLNSCESFTNYDSEKKISAHFDAGTKFDWLYICDKAKLNDYNNILSPKSFFENHFTPYLVKNGRKTKGLFTGYHEPLLRGSFTKSETYKYPIYKAPDNLGEESLSRKNINEGSLEGKNLEILYTDDDIELFFMHIQGSGSIILDNGEIIRVGYHAQNGHKYFALGRHLIQEHNIDKNLINADFIKKFLRDAHNRKEIMELNPSYIFFKVKDNIYGSLGSKLIAERSLAVDRRYIPLGVPLWLETTYPLIGTNFSKMLIAQDTGGAIKGVVRGDIFFGSGEIAAKYASNMKNQGSYYILLPKKRLK